MDADIVSLSDALVERLMPVLTTIRPDWAVVWFKPDPVVQDTVCVRPNPAGFVDYQAVPPLWSFRVSFYLSATDQEGARRDMASMTAKTGPVITTLHDTTIQDALAGLAQFTVAVTRGTGFETVRERRGVYLYTEIGVQVGAN